MKYYLILMLVIGHMGCDSSSENTPAVATDSTENQEDQADIPNQGSSNPGEITFRIKIMESYDTGKDICGVSRENVHLIEVLEVLESGSGITHMPRKEEELLVNFLLTPKDLEANTLIEAIGKESLCPDTSKTYFTINSYKILD